MKILEQIGRSGAYNYMKACARVARLGRKVKILEQIVLRRPYNLVRTRARTARLGQNDRQTNRRMYV